jgi:hypothetical protein
LSATSARPTIRCWINPFAYAFEPLLSPLVVATLLVIAHPVQATALALGIAATVQLVVAPLQTMILRGRSLPLWLLPLEIVRAYLHFACWLAGWATRRVVWRGHVFDLGRGSRLRPVREPHLPVDRRSPNA